MEHGGCSAHDMMQIVMPTELDYCAPHPTQSAIERVWKEKVMVTGDALKSQTVKIRVPSSSEYTALHNTQLQVTCKVTKPAGANCDHGAAANPDRVCVANNVLHTMWKRIVLNINGQTVDDSTPLYPYRAYFEQLFGLRDGALKKRKTLCGWEKDTAAKFAVKKRSDGNAGMDARTEQFKDSQVVVLMGTPHLDVCNQNLLLPPGLPLEFEFEKQEHGFVLISEGDTKYELHILEVVLWIERAKVRDELAMAHVALFSKLPENKLFLPARRNEMETFQMTSGVNKITGHQLFSTGILPDRILLGFIKVGANTATYGENPFNFQHFKVKQISLAVGGSGTVPAVAYKPDFTTPAGNGCVREYYSLLEEFGVHEGNATIDLSLADFCAGYTFFAFRLTPRFDDGNLLTVPQTASVTLDCEFAENIPAIEVIVLGEVRKPIVVPLRRTNEHE
jgi:hypothetical protein